METQDYKLSNSELAVDSIGNQGRQLTGLTAQLPDEVSPLNLVGGLHAAFSEYVLSWYERSGNELNYISTGSRPQHLAQDLEITIFRVFQEAVANIFKHSFARNVFVSIEHADESISLTIDDDGIGFDHHEPDFSLYGPAKLGLKVMRERVAHVGGTLRIDSVIGKGTGIRIRIPVGYEG